MIEHHSPPMDNIVYKPVNDVQYHPYPAEFVPQSRQEPHPMHTHVVPNETGDMVKVVVQDDVVIVPANTAAVAAVVSDHKNANVHVPKSSQPKHRIPHQPHSVDVNENASGVVHNEPQHNVHGSGHGGPINGLVQATEKLSLRSERGDRSHTGHNKHHQHHHHHQPTGVASTPAWASKKSTQSVAVSVVPSNNYPMQQPNGEFNEDTHLSRI